MHQALLVYWPTSSAGSIEKWPGRQLVEEALDYLLRICGTAA